MMRPRFFCEKALKSQVKKNVSMLSGVRKKIVSVEGKRSAWIVLGLIIVGFSGFDIIKKNEIKGQPLSVFVEKGAKEGLKILIVLQFEISDKMIKYFSKKGATRMLYLKSATSNEMVKNRGLTAF